jgi:serine/threonine protein kinase
MTAATAQTRFSFYNADDFKVSNNDTTTTATMSGATDGPFVSRQPSSSHSGMFDARKKKANEKSPHSKAPLSSSSPSTKAKMQLHLQQQQRQRGSSKQRSGGGILADSVAEGSVVADVALRSLPASERGNVDLQELQANDHVEITSVTSATKSEIQERQQPTLQLPGIEVSAQQQPLSSNPYEDAIKEALDLLRKHRVALSPKTLPRQVRHQQQPPYVRANSLPNEATSSDPDRSESPQAPPGGVSLSSPFTPRHADRVLRSRGDDASSAGGGAESAVSASLSAALARRDFGSHRGRGQQQQQQQQHYPQPPDTPDSSFLGETYQLEIEARRKQRQERMAKYATFLAELKQDGGGEGSSTTPLPAGGGGFAETSSAATTPSRVVSSHQPRSFRQLRVVNQSQNDALQPTSRSEIHRNHNPPYAESDVTAGTVSTMTALTNPNAQDDEVQRGVEKVLLAILERANHRSLSSQSQSSSAGEGESGSAHLDRLLEGGDRPSSWQQGEEKKSSSEEFGRYDDATADENSLVQAVSDLLGAQRSLSSSSSAPLTASRSLSPAPASADRPPQEHRPFKYSDMAPSIDVDDFDPISASRSMSDAGGYRPANSSLVDDDVPLPASQPPPPPRHHRVVSSPLPAGTSEIQRTYFATELANTSDGQIEAVASDPGLLTELDELVRQASDRSRETGLLQSSSAIAAKKTKASSRDETIDEKVRRLLQGGNEERESRPEEDPSSDEDVSVQNSSVMDRTSKSSSCSFDESLLDDDENEDDDRYDDASDSRNRSAIDRVLGPLSRKGTGVVLEPDSPEPQDLAPSILESLSAAVSMVVSGNSATGSKGGGLFSDKFTSDDEESESESSGTDESDSNGLMRSLCAHLLPVGVSQTSKILDKLPEWDESNPDEPGYRVVRLTRQQLRRVEEEFLIMADKLKHNSEQNLQRVLGSDEAFERDLKAAEELLDREEERLKVSTESTKGACEDQLGKLRRAPDSPDRHSVASADDENASIGLPNFPGVKRAGEGEMGDLEFFYLPIIFKSHVTGFEPTKDLRLEAGNVVAGQYLVEGELGSAAFSTAYRCIDLNSHGSGPDGHEEVCLKVIKNTKDFFDQSLDEIKILELLRQTGKCREKSIVEMKTFFYHREHLIIVTELLKQNLFEFGKLIVDNDEEPYFTLPRLAFITRQVLVALDFVHGLGLVHSDVKPENILLGSYSQAKVKLIDFGSSCYLTDRQSSYIQSRSYRAPEVILGLPYDGRIDIWSLGCVVAEMFTGEVTFQNDSIVSMLSRIEAICGPFPRYMIVQGRQAGRFFTKCGLLFERTHREVEKDDDDSKGTSSSEDEPKTETLYDIFQPKITTLAARLGLDSDVLESYRKDSATASKGKTLFSAERYSEQSRRGMFVDFVRCLLTIDPESRPTAAQALQHPWMQYAASLSDTDIRYPTSSE